MDYIDASGCPRNYGEGFVDASGVYRNYGEGFVDYSGVYRQHNEAYVDKSGYMRYPGEGFTDGEGHWREPKSSLRYLELTQEIDRNEAQEIYSEKQTSSYSTVQSNIDWSGIVYKVVKYIFIVNILTLLFPVNPLVLLVLNSLKRKKQELTSSFKFALFLSKFMLIEWIIAIIILIVCILLMKNDGNLGSFSIYDYLYLH